MNVTTEHPEAQNGRDLNVTLIGTLPPHMGVADYTAHLVGGLTQARGLSLEVIDFVSLYPRWMYPGGRVRDSTARSPQFPNVRIRKLLAWYNPLSWILAGVTLRGQVVHAQWWSYPLAPLYLTILAIARLRRRKVILTVHNVEPHEGGWWRRFLNSCVLDLAHSYIVHTDRGRDSLVRQVDNPNRIAVVPHGILTSPGPSPSAADARNALGLPQSAKVVLSFGNVRAYKGIGILLRAFATVRAEVPDALLMIAGNPWEDWAPYQALIEELELPDVVRTHLEFVPAEQVATFFAAADVVVLPYTHLDAQSGVATRALHYGKALVVTDVGGLPDLAADGRFVVPPGDVNRLSEALTELLTDKETRQQLEEEAKVRACGLQWDAIAQKTVVLYHALASAPLDRSREVEGTGRRSPQGKR